MSKTTFRKLMLFLALLSAAFGIIFPILEFFDITAKDIPLPDLPTLTQEAPGTRPLWLVLVADVVGTCFGALFLFAAVSVLKEPSKDEISYVGVALGIVVGASALAAGLWNLWRLIQMVSAYGFTYGV